MAKELVIRCNICGTTKGVTNHWHVLSVNDGSQGKRNLTLRPLEETDNAPWQIFVCSEKCTMIVVSRALDSWRRNEPVQEQELTQKTASTTRGPRGKREKTEPDEAVVTEGGNS